MKAKALRIVVVVALVFSAGPALAADALQPQFGSAICHLVSRVLQFWSVNEVLPTPTTQTIGSETTETYELADNSNFIHQTFANECHRNAIEGARDYYNLRFTMIRRYKKGHPEQDFLPEAIISYDFKSYVDPVWNQRKGETLWRIRFYNRLDQLLSDVYLNTRKEPNCWPWNKVYPLQFRFTFPRVDLNFWSNVSYFRVAALSFQTEGRCEHN